MPISPLGKFVATANFGLIQKTLHVTLPRSKQLNNCNFLENKRWNVVEGKSSSANGEASNDAPSVDPAILEKIEKVRDHVRDSFGKVTMAMMAMPRYRHQTLADLNHLVLDPLTRDRLAIAYAPKQDGKLNDVAGFAIWASVSEEVDAKIREQIKAGVFPVRLKSDEWSSGSINWLMDVIAPDPQTTARVIGNLGSVMKGRDIRMHPIVSRLVEKETLEKMGASQVEPKQAS